MNIVGITPSDTLSQIWERAEAMGEVTVSRDYQFGMPGETSSRYRVEIRCTTAGGSKFWATGLDMSIHVALVKALAEADLLSTAGDHP